MEELKPGNKIVAGPRKFFCLTPDEYGSVKARAVLAEQLAEAILAQGESWLPSPLPWKQIVALARKVEGA